MQIIQGRLWAAFFFAKRSSVAFGDEARCEEEQKVSSHVEVNSFAHFNTKGGLQYLFMQGGTSGVADDSLVQIAGVSGTNLSVASAVKLTFSGSLT